MHLQSVRIVNCFGFRDSGDVSLDDSSDFIYVLGKNSSGKTALLTAIEALSSTARAPKSFDRFENFDSSGSAPTLFGRFVPPGASGATAASALAPDILWHHLLAALAEANVGDRTFRESDEYEKYLQALEPALRAIYAPLIAHLNGAAEVWVRRTGDGDYAISADADFSDVPVRMSEVQGALDAAFVLNKGA